MSKIDLNQLNDIQYDVLKEIGNIGAGNATTATTSTVRAIPKDDATATSPVISSL